MRVEGLGFEGFRVLGGLEGLGVSGFGGSGFGGFRVSGGLKSLGVWGVGVQALGSRRKPKSLPTLYYSCGVFKVLYPSDKTPILLLGLWAFGCRA